jgi:hypothetical protein
MFATLALAMGCADAPQFDLQAPSDRLGVWIADPGATILRTEQSTFANPTLTVVSDPATWLSLWSQAWGGPQASPALPALDFVLSSVIVVGLGKRTGQGYGVSIDSVVVRTVGAVLYGTESQPGAHCNASVGTFSPVQMVRYPGHPPIMEWRLEAIRRECASAAPAR